MAESKIPKRIATSAGQSEIADSQNRKDGGVREELNEHPHRHWTPSRLEAQGCL